MTREDAWNEIDAIIGKHEIDDEYVTITREQGYEALRVAREALEKKPIIDKLIDEIMDIGAYEQEVNGNTEFLKGINYCLGVIDKYKTEVEDEG